MNFLKFVTFPFGKLPNILYYWCAANCIPNDIASDRLCTCYILIAGLVDEINGLLDKFEFQAWIALLMHCWRLDKFLEVYSHSTRIVGKLVVFVKDSVNEEIICYFKCAEINQDHWNIFNSRKFLSWWNLFWRCIIEN